MDVCSGNTYPQLESIIPQEASKKPSLPESFIKDDNQKSSIDLILSHHGMDGSKMHHSIGDGKSQSNKNNNNKNNMPLSYYLNQPDIPEDYYDEIERDRTKSRKYKNKPYYDTNELDDPDADYLSLGDQAQSLLLSAALDKLNAITNKKPGVNKNNLLAKHINKLLPKTVSSKPT